MFHMRIASESRTRLSFLELSIFARREEGAQDCDAQIGPAHPMLGGRDKVVYLVRTPRLIMLALAAEGRFWMTGMRGRALVGSGRRGGLLEGVFITCVWRVVRA